MRGLLFSPKHNSPGKHDADGAFIPSVHTFCLVNHIPLTDLYEFDNSKPLQDRADEILAMIAQAVAANGKHYADVIAFFCHGWPKGIQAGFDLRAPRVARHDAADLGLALNEVGHEGFTTLLYACSTAEDRTHGFARELFTEMPGCVRLFAHDRPGHAVKNPFVVRYDDANTVSEASTGGGSFAVEPHGPGWKTWVHDLQHTDLWASFW